MSVHHSSFAVNTVLTAAERGVVLIDASAQNRTITLPASNAALGVIDFIVRRTDSSTNRLVVQATGTDRIKFHTHLKSEGYPFFVLMGAGDWWHIRSDGAGGWFPIGRFDSLHLGRPVMETTVVFPPGGYGAVNGGLFNRADWPWLWDHAQQSGMLTTEAARSGMEGGWTSGDGALTFRGPEVRGEFLRVLDETRNVDPSRVAGSYQRGSLLSGNNTVDNEVHSFQNVEGTRSGLGWELPTMSQYSGTSGYTPVQVTTPGGLFTIAHYGVARPRSIAYPGRIKLI